VHAPGWLNGGWVELGWCRPRGPASLAAAVLLLGLLTGPARLGGQVPSALVSETVVLENDAVRVALLTFPPGAASGRHAGLDPELGVVLEGELTLVTDAGPTTLGPGAAHWLPGLLPHDARNETDRPARLWVVLLKRCG
jgi:quercetin dioxygenase-like cupin family protein